MFKKNLVRLSMIGAFAGFIAGPVRAEETEADKLAAAQNKFLGFEIALNNEYKALKSKLGDSPLADELVESQRAWGGWRKILVKADFGTDESADRYDDFSYFSQRRIGYFIAFTGENTKKGLIGNYDDYTGGQLKITSPSKGLFHASLEVVRGHTHAEGSMEGDLVFPNGGNNGTITAEGSPACVVKFNHDDKRNRIFLTEATKDGCADVRPSRAVFQGTFLKSDYKDVYESIKEINTED